MKKEKLIFSMVLFGLILCTIILLVILLSGKSTSGEFLFKSDGSAGGLIYRTEDELYINNSDDFLIANKDGNFHDINQSYIVNYISDGGEYFLRFQHDYDEQYIGYVRKYDSELNLLDEISIINNQYNDDIKCSIIVIQNKIYLFISSDKNLQMDIIDIETLNIEESYKTTTITKTVEVMDKLIIEEDKNITFYFEKAYNSTSYITKLDFNLENKIFTEKIIDLDIHINQEFYQINETFFTIYDNKIIKYNYDFNVIDKYDLGDYSVQYIDSFSNTILIKQVVEEKTNTIVLDENFDTINTYVINDACSALYKFSDETFLCRKFFMEEVGYVDVNTKWENSILNGVEV